MARAVSCVAVTFLLSMMWRNRREEARRERVRRVARRRRLIQFRKKQAKRRQLMFMALLLCCIGLNERHGRVWEKKRSSHWWENVATSFTSEEWLTNFRMSRSTFDYLVQRLSATISKADTNMRKAIRVKKRLAVTLYFLASGVEYRTTGHLFGISKSSVCYIVKKVCECIVSVLLPQYVKVPIGSDLDDVVNRFTNKLGFPQCVGAIDRCHIPIISPKECPADYYNRKGWHSIILQGTVDSKGLFMDVYVGWPGRVHDARVFVNSSLFKRGQEGSLVPNKSVSLGGSNVPLVLLGDPAYPLLPWLMKAFINNGQLTSEQKLFNYSLSKARVVVEHAYGRLKGRWRCLLKRLDVDVADVPMIVTACCVLHNITEVKGDIIDVPYVETESAVISQPSTLSLDCTSTQPCNDSVSIRNALMYHFKTVQ